jgi:hypothetical protein
MSETGEMLIEAGSGQLAASSYRWIMFLLPAASFQLLAVLPHAQCFFTTDN